MLLNYFRLFKYDGANFTDYSIVNQEESTITPVITSSDYLYIAQEFPFNNFHVYLDTVNASASDITIEYWDGKDWVEGVDILDGTAVGGASLGKTGVVQFSPNIQNGWIPVNETDKNPAPNELNALNIYNLYWMRISFDNDLDAGTIINEVGYSFTTTKELNNYDIEINNFYNAFESGKTDWVREIITASKMLVLDLKRLNIVIHPGQILRFDTISMTAAYKTLELIYMNLGPSYNDKRLMISEMYGKTLNIDSLTIDTNKDAFVDTKEILSTTRKLIR